MREIDDVVISVDYKHKKNLRGIIMDEVIFIVDSDRSTDTLIQKINASVTVNKTDPYLDPTEQKLINKRYDFINSYMSAVDVAISYVSKAVDSAANELMISADTLIDMMVVLELHMIYHYVKEYNINKHSGAFNLAISHKVLEDDNNIHSLEVLREYKQTIASSLNKILINTILDIDPNTQPGLNIRASIIYNTILKHLDANVILITKDISKGEDGNTCTIHIDTKTNL